MSVQKRRCATCRYFDDAGMSGNGWCTHPKRQLSSDVRILVRRGELACRNSWGVDYWEDRDGEAPAVAEPAPAAPASLSMQGSFDDEVTSVVTADPDRVPAPDTDDRVVEQTTLQPDDIRPTPRHSALRDVNEPARLDQQERVDIMARGNRHAILRARERHQMRRTRFEDPLPGSYDDEEPAQPESRRTEFAPDDYVEDEIPATTVVAVDTSAEPADVVLDEGSVPPTARSRRFRRSREEAPTDAVPRAEMSPDTQHLTSRRSDDARFDTVPEIKAEVELPRLRRHVPEAFAPVVAATAAGAPETVNPFDEVLKKAQAIKAAARAEREARQQQARRPIVPPLFTDEPADEPAPEPEPEPVVETQAWREPAASEWSDEPAAEDDWDEASFAGVESLVEPDPAQHAEPAWLASRGIRFQRQRAEPEVAAEPEDEAYDEVWDDEPRSQPEASRSWWRGWWSGRGRHDARADEYVDARSAVEIEDSLDTYETWDDELYIPEENEGYEREEWGVEEFDRDYVEPVELTASQSVIATSEEAWVADAHDFLEHPRQQLPWQHAGASTAVLDALHEPTYEPLDLEDEHGLDAFRSRLFAAAPVEHEQEPERRTPLAMHRQPQEAPRPVETRPLAAEALLEDPRDAMYEPETDPNFDVRTLIAQQREMLDMTIRIAPDVPRTCATCRSYRASEQGERGWCTNNWAFTHRQMVNHDDLACQSTIGCWWLPADDKVWLEDDAATAARPTPRVDRMVAHLDPVSRVASR